MSAARSVPLNLLFIAEGQLGDLLLLTPAIRSVKESFPHCAVSVLVVERRTLAGSERDGTASGTVVTEGNARNSPLGNNPHVVGIFTVSRSRLRSQKGLSRLRAELQIARFLRRRKFDTVVCTFPEDRFVLWAWASSARVRIGQRNQPLSALLTHTPALDRKDKGVLEYYCDLVRCIGADVKSVQTEYVVPLDEGVQDGMLSDWNVLGGIKKEYLVVIHPGASGEYKIWPPDRYSALIDMLHERSALKCILAYARGDMPVVNEILSRLRTPVIKIETGEDLPSLAHLLKRSALCISNDSGPRHLAVAVGTPSIAIIRRGHDEWNVYESSSCASIVQSNSACPQCPPGTCHDRIPEGETYGSYCMREISVQEVWDAVSRVCGESPYKDR